MRKIYYIIRYLLNKAKRSNALKSNILLFGSPRSGSTWIAESIHHSINSKKINEPFFQKNLNFNGISNNHIRILNINENPQLINYILNINNQKIDISSLNDFKQLFYSFESGIWKILRANWIIDEIEKIIPNSTIICLVRNPLNSCSSRYYNKWGDHCSYYLENLSNIQFNKYDLERAQIRNLYLNSSEFERYVIGWCFDNLPLLKRNRNVFYYEKIKGKKNITVNNIMIKLNKNRSKSSKYSKNKIYPLNSQEIINCNNILKHFKINEYKF